MTLSQGAIGNLINRYRAVLKKCRLMNVFGSLAAAGLLVAGGAGSAGAEDTYYYVGTSAAGAANDCPGWQDATAGAVDGIIGKTEGTPVEYRFLPGIYDGSKTSAATWLIGANGDVRIVSDGPLTIRKWGNGILPDQGVITAQNGSIAFGDNVTVRDNYSSATNTKGGGAIYSDTGITFGDNASLIRNMTMPPQSGSYYGGGAIFLNAAPDGQLVFGKNALLEKNEANYAGAIYSLGSVTFGEGAIIRGNRASTQGGALRVTGTLTLNSGSLVQGNRADGSKPYGGAVFMDGKADITGTAFQNNTALGGNGGAVYLQGGGTLHLSGGSLLEGNEAAMGGAILANKSGVDVNDTSFITNKADKGGAVGVLNAPLTVQTAGEENGTGTLFQGNIAPSMGGAIYAQDGSVTIGDGTRLEGNQAAKGGGLYISGDGTNAAIISKAQFKENTASDSGGAIHAEKADVTLTGTRMEGNEGNLGGGVAALKSTLTFTDAAFINNTAVQGGGALFVQDGSLLFKVAQTPTAPLISGNSAGAAGGFLYLSRSTATFDVAEGAQLQIGDALYTGNDAHMDSLCIMPDASMKKTGAGELKINSAMGELWGTVGVEAGTMSVARHWNIKNAVTLSGGTLELPSFSFAAPDAASHVAGGKLTISGGTLVTATGQIFETPLNAAGDNEDAGGVKADVDAHMDFASGLIAFDDAKYNLQYAGSAAAALGASYDQQAGQPGDKEITFTGKLYTPSDPAPNPEPAPTPGPSGAVTTGDLKTNNITNVVLGNATIATDPDPAGGKNLIVGATTVDDPRFTAAEDLPGSIGSRNLDLGPNGSAVAVTGGHYLTLVGGAADTPLIMTGNGGQAPVDVLAGASVNGQPSGGTLNLGTPAMPSGGILNGTVRLAASSALNVRAGEFTLTGRPADAGVVNDGGTINVAEGAALRASIRQASGETHVAGRLESSLVELEDGNFNVSGAADIGRLEADKGLLRVVGLLRADSLDAAPGLRVEVGDGNAAGKLHVASASLSGAGLFLDPVWRGSDTITDASHAVLNFRHQEVDGQLAVGRNSLLALGDVSADWSIRVFDSSGLRWGPEGVTAAASVRAPQRLDPAKGALAVDGSLTTAPTLTPNTATFADGSLLMVDASGLKGHAALTAQGGTLTVADTASLRLGNVARGEYVITEGFTNNKTDVRGWEGDLLSATDRLMALSLDKSVAGAVKVRARALDAGDVFPDLALRTIVNEVWSGGRNDVNSPNMGIRFLSRAVNKDYLSLGTANVIDGAAQIAVAGGVQGMALASASAPVRAVRDHASLARSVARQGGEARGEGIKLWIDALYGANRARGFAAGALDGGYNADFGGVVFGGDVGAGPFRVGVALDAGGGTARSRGDFASTKNDFDFWGVTFYGTWARDRFNFMADAGYAGGSHEVRQDLPASLRLGRLTADVDTRVVSAGLRAEYLIPTAWADVMPHVGARYAALTTGAFTSHMEGGDVFRIGRDTQRIWTFPAGVTLGREVRTESGWKVRSRADLSVVPAAGGVKARTRARVPGVVASDAVRARIMDPLSFDGSVGLELEKDHIALGLNCGLLASEHRTAPNLAVRFTYRF